MKTQVKTTKIIQQKKSKPRKKYPKRKLAIVSPHIGLSECAKIYLRALANPFGNFGSKLPCIPDSIPVPSRKLKVTIRGTCTQSITGSAAGYGYVVFNPWLAVVNDGGLSGSACNFPIIFTNTGYNGATGTFTVAVSGGAFTTLGVNGQNSNSPFTTSTFTTNAWDYRVVSAGLRARYIGNNFYNSGRLLQFRDQNNDSIQSGLLNSTLLNDMYTQTVPNNDESQKWAWVTIPQSRYDLLTYQPLSQYSGISLTNLPDNHFCLLIFLDGMDIQNAQSVEFEAVAFYEITGRNLDTSPSESDPEGFAAVGSAVSKIIRSPTKSPEVVERTILGAATEYLSNKLSAAAPQLLNYGGQVLGSAARSYFGVPNVPMISQGPTVTEL